jgi:hypothetical protein
MAEAPKLTEFEQALEAAEREKSGAGARVNRVHWPAPGASGAAYPAPPRGAKAPALAPQPLPHKAVGPIEEASEPAKNIPPKVLIIAAVALVVIAGAAFFIMKKGKGGSQNATTEVALPAKTPAPTRVTPTPSPTGAAPAAGSPAGASVGGPSGSPAKAAAPPAAKPTTPATPAQPTTPAQPAVTVTQAEYDQLQTGLTYAQVVSIIGGDGKVIADGVEPSTGDQVTIYEWAGEGLQSPYVHVKFTNGALSLVTLI